MISDHVLKEFGFENISKFPRLLTDHEVTISLPTAVAHQVKPATVVIHHGIAIPVQVPGVPNGMIIRDDGKMVFVSHANPKDYKSPLEVSFTDDIAYDVRLDAFNIMRRAVEVDPDLMLMWGRIMTAWNKWFPPFLREVQTKRMGEFKDVKLAFMALTQVIEKFTLDSTGNSREMAVLPFKIVVQTESEIEKGWQGEEFVVDEITIGQVLMLGVSKYAQLQLKNKMRRVLKNPVFGMQSTFEVLYEQRVMPVFKFLVKSPANSNSPDAFTNGIDLD